MRPEIAGILGLVALTGCAKVPITGRPQFNVIPESLMISLGKTSYGDALAGQKIERKTDDAELLNSVMSRISAVTHRPDYRWDASLIESDEINAWCLPGGYIGFYTGILPVLRHEAGMAFVMGHEVGHAIARHGAERLTQQLTLFGGLAGLTVLLDQESKLNGDQRALVVGALGLGVEVAVLLPFSRTHESEADVIGMMYMARAGYPPEEAITLWDRMSRQTGGSSLPVFLSTHPSDDKRQEKLKEWMPQANKRYDRHKLSYDTVAKKW